ncbi:polyketide synthase [Ophiocordyceps sinensis CO18]|uniref:Polyketide synthase n=1 Tax=Ophiocordyceps sinensis (strain Co18 / CGMCC 3.14243) TaxID=911162 RepID=T5ALW1_OPHSC|nr:polyketide synthase [Ophiocordyceps sinensis CO18]
MEDIAVVGLGLRFPGEATSPEELWGVLERAESQWSEFPADRLNIDGYFHPGGDRQGSISFRGAHFLKGDIAAFDSPFFSVAAEDAKAIDPQQRMLLEVSYEALESAGLRKEDLDGSDTAVYVGSFVKDYEQICLRDPDWQPRYAATGNGIAIMANRISHFFNFHGPSMTLDTGCSGSLVSVHLAAQSLRNGESSLAIAAGSGMILTPNTIMPMTALNFLSPDGKCFTFDSRANGYGRGEGIGVVVLKRLSDALRDNDTIRAVIRGSAVNQDGRTPGITLPSKEAQVSNIRGVYKGAGLDFDQTAYVECHGTGTQAGDWRGVRAIAETLGADRPADRPVVVGAIKPNIGHLEGAAGVAGLIKGVMVLEHAKIPPNINFESGNPTIDFEEWRVKVPQSVMEWPMKGLRRVSVNCFGFGGTNAHVILDEAPAYLSARGLTGHHSSVDNSSVDNSPRRAQEAPPCLQLLCYSSHEKNGVLRIIKSHLGFFDARQQACSAAHLRDYAYTLGCRRSTLEWRGFVVAGSLSDLASQVEGMGNDAVVRASRDKKPRVCFVFCGQGAQWAQMGKHLIPFDPFRLSLEEAARYMSAVLGSPFDLVTEILRDGDETFISQAHISQPATTAVQIALVDLVKSFGILPRHVVGHSSGEIAAAYASGALSRQEAWQVAYYRGLAASSIPIIAPKLKGAMMVVGMSHEETETYLASVNQSAQVACINSPRSITISGQSQAIDFIDRDLRSKKIFCRVLNVNVAYHSSHMKLVAHDYRASLVHITPRSCSPSVGMLSSVTGQAVKGTELDASYWASNMVSPVQYVAAIETLMQQPVDERPDVIIELSPRPSLRSPTSDILSAETGDPQPAYRSILDRKGDGAAALLELVGELWSQGYPIDMEAVLEQGLLQQRPKCLSDLPPYPWNHAKSYWHESHLSLANRFREYGRQDLIGAPTADSVPFEPRWRGFLRVSENPWIQDHQVQKTIVYPAAGMVSMVLEGARQMSRAAVAGYEIANMQIEKAMIIPNTAHGLEVAMNIKSCQESPEDGLSSEPVEFSIYSKPFERDWERNARGSLYFRTGADGWDAVFRSCDAQHKALDESCTEALKPRQLYEFLDTVGMNYGPLFQNITEIRKGGNCCVGKVRVPDTKSKMPAKFEFPHLIHPATLDSMFQTLFAIDSSPMVPTFIKSIFVSANVDDPDPSPFAGYAVAERTGIRDADATIVMTRPGPTPARVVIEGLHLTGLSTPSPTDGGFLPNHRNLCTEIVWKQDAAFARPIAYAEQVALLAHKYPALAVLQIGGGPAVTSATLAILAPNEDETPRLSRYTVVERPGTDDAEQARSYAKDTSLEDFLEFKKDCSELLVDYHLIVAFADTGIDTDSLKKHLRAGGVLLHQPVASTRSKSNGNVAPKDSQVSCQVEMTISNRPSVSMNTFRCPPEPVSGAASHSIAVLLPEAPSVEALAFAAGVKQGLGPKVFSVSVQQVQDDTALLVGSLVISLLDFAEFDSENCSVFDWNESGFEAFHAVQKSAKGIFWITRGAHMKPLSPKGAPIIALARTLMSEDPLKTIVTLDLSLHSRLGHLPVIQTAVSVFRRAFQTSPGSDPRETEYAEEDGKLYVPRLSTVQSLNQLIEGDNHHGGFVQRPFSCPVAELSHSGLGLTIAKPGIDDGYLYFSEFDQPELGPDDIEIEFEKTSLTHLDLDTVMGRTVESTLGMDVVGRVKRVGSSVTGFHPEDCVAALVSGGAIQNTIHAKEKLATKYRPGLNPSLYVSAYHAIIDVGRARSGRKVLIQAGASAYGLAAVQMARSVDAEVFATVLGPESTLQREILVQSGVADDHIFDVDSDSFVKAVQAASSGRGVDIVYNPTTEHVEAGFKCVRKCGTVVQFANKSPSPRALPMVEGSVTVVNFDLCQLLREEWEYVAGILHRATRHMAERLPALPLHPGVEHSYGIDKLEDALRHIQRSPYVGYSSLSAEGSKVSVVNKNPTKPLSQALDGNGTYLLAGGLGGLGQSISELLVSNGVRHLAYVSRSGASSGKASSFIKGLRASGIDARAYSSDICDEAALTNLIANRVTAEMPPIKGVFQCAAVIKDAVFDNMTYNDWVAATKPKTVGSLSLVRSMAAAGQDPFFIFLASSAGVIGNRGQANYAAGNCFEDALARNCRLQGKHAVSIDLGPVLGAGMLAEDDEILSMLRASGFYGIRHGDFLKVVEHAITMETTPGTSMPAQVILGVGTGGIIRQNQPADPYWSRTALYGYLVLVDMPPPDLTATPGRGALVDVKTMLACCTDTASAAEIVKAGLVNMLAKAMTMLPEELDANKPPNAYGVDSLVAVGVRNFVISSFGVAVSVFEVLSDATIAELSTVIAVKGGFGTDKAS